MSRESNICSARKSDSYSRKTLHWTSDIHAQSKSERVDLYRHVSLVESM